LILTSGAQAAGVTNGSFEDTTGFVNQGNDTMSLPGGSTAMTGWTVTGDSVAWIGPANPFSVSASDNDYFLDLTDYPIGAPFGGVSQAVATANGASYALSFDLGSSSYYGLFPVITVSAGAFTQSFTGTALGTNNWESQVFNFSATGPLTTITLQGSSGYAYIGLDNLSLVQTSGGVPEPAAWSLMLVGFCGMGAMLRRRRGMAAA
jgi:hypothetical protein